MVPAVLRAHPFHTHLSTTVPPVALPQGKRDVRPLPAC